MKLNYKPLITEEEINSKIKELGEIINNQITDNTVIIPVLNGSFMFASDLLKQVSKPIHLEFTTAKSYVGMKSSGQVQLMVPDIDYADKDIIIIEDIVETGRTISELKKEFLNRGASSVKVITLLDKPMKREIEFKPDIVGFTIEDKFVIGYGLDYDHHGRNLPFIAEVLKGDIIE